MSVVFQSVASADSGKVSGTSLTMSSEVLIPKGATIVFRCAYDNTSTGTTSPAPAPGTVTCSVPGALTGLTLRGARGSGSASGAGVNLAVWTATAALDISAGTNFTVTVAAAVTARAISMQYAGGTTFASAVTAGGTTGTGTVTVNATSATQVATVTIAREYNETTTYGAVAGWEQGILEGTKGGNALTNVSMMSARKYPVGATGNHTWNPSGNSGDWSGVGLLFNDTSPSVSSLNPTSAVRSSAAVIEITGLNFTNVSNVTLGGISATSFTVNSATSITATFDTTSLPIGAATLVVYANGAYSDGDTYTLLTDPPQPPTPITNFRVDWDHYYNREIVLRWDSPGATANIQIFRNGTSIATLAPGVTKYRDANLTLDNSYTYSIRAYNGLGEQTAVLPPHLLTTRIPSVTYSQGYLRAASTSHPITMPSAAQLRPYDIILVTAQRVGTGALNPNSGNWSEWPGVINASTIAAGNIWYYRIQPNASDPTLPIVPTLTLSSGTSVELAVTVQIIRDTDVYTNEFLYKEPYVPTMGIGTSGDAANAVKGYPNVEGISGSGLMLHFAGVTTNATATPTFTHYDSGTRLMTPTTSGRNYIRITTNPVTEIGSTFNYSYSVNTAASHVQDVLWFSEAAVAKIPFSTSSGMSQNIASSIDISLGTMTPATGDHVIICLTLASGTGAVSASLVSNVGFSAPIKIYDSTNTDPNVRTVYWSSYGTAATNAGPLSYRLTYPSSHIAYWGTYAKNVGNVTPVVVGKSSIGPDTVSIDLASKAVLIGNMATYGHQIQNAGFFVPSSEGWSGIDAALAETNAVAVTTRVVSPAPYYGNYFQMGEAHEAGTAKWTTDLPGTYTNPVLRTIIALPSPNLRFGQSSVDAITSIAQFAAFGIPL